MFKVVKHKHLKLKPIKSINQSIKQSCLAWLTDPCGIHRTSVGVVTRTANTLPVATRYLHVVNARDVLSSFLDDRTNVVLCPSVVCM